MTRECTSCGKRWTDDEYGEALCRASFGDDHSVALDEDGYCPSCGESEVVVDEREAAYQRAAMESAREQFHRDRPYLRMARERGVRIESERDMKQFKREVAA